MSRELSSEISKNLLAAHNTKLKWIYLGTKVDSCSCSPTDFDSIFGIDHKYKVIYADSIFGYRIAIYPDAKEYDIITRFMEANENEKITEFVESIVFEYLNPKDVIDMMKYKIDNAYETGYENHKKDLMEIIGLRGC